MRRGLLVLVALVSIPRAAWPQGNPLGPEFRINTYTTGGQGDASIASDSSGNFVVVWISAGQDGPVGYFGGLGVFGQRYASSGAPLGPEFRINTYTTGDQFGFEQAVASDISGNFVVVWISDLQDGSDFGVFGQRFANSGVPLGPEFRVNTYTTSYQTLPSVAADASGNFVVVWHSAQEDGSDSGVFGQRYASSGTPLGAEFRVNTFTTSDQGGPAVASEASGNFVVVWNSLDQDSSYTGVFGQRFASSGPPLGPEFRVNTYTTYSQGGPHVVADASGSFVVVWTSGSQDGSYGGVFGQRYASSGTPLGPEFRVNTYTTSYQGGPRVAADASGNFVVVWTSYLQDVYFDVFGQRYASSGAPLGFEFRVNTYTTSAQVDPVVASDSSGHFVVVWHSGFQDGSATGVFGQRHDSLPVELMHFEVE